MHRQFVKRQNSEPTAVPSANGVAGSLTASQPSGTKLVVDSSTSTPSSGPEFAAGSNTFVLTSTSTTTDAPSQSPSESPTLTGAKSGVQLSTVIGVCIGTFIAAGLLICLSVWFYRRSLRRPSPRARRNQPLAQSRGVNPTAPWTRFDDDQDQWDGRGEMAEKTEPGNVALASGTLRAASPQPTRRSLTSDDHFGSQHDVADKSLPFAQYHPKLAEQMALEPPRPVGVNDEAMASIDGSTNGSFLSLATVRIESGKMSPTFNVAKTTPPATASRLHHWESAEVVDPEGHAQEVEIHDDPFSEQSTPTTYSVTETIGDRRSLHNPFFNAHPGVHSRRPSATRKSSAMSVSSDPFSKDDHTITAPKPRFASHAAHDSSSSGGSVGNEKAMESLIAALDLPKDVIEERLRVGSMQSEVSMYSTTADSPFEYAIPIPETAERGYMGQ